MLLLITLLIFLRASLFVNILFVGLTTYLFFSLSLIDLSTTIILSKTIFVLGFPRHFYKAGIDALII